MTEFKVLNSKLHLKLSFSFFSLFLLRPRALGWHCACALTEEMGFFSVFGICPTSLAGGPVGAGVGGRWVMTLVPEQNDSDRPTLNSQEQTQVSATSEKEKKSCANSSQCTLATPISHMKKKGEPK